MMPCLALPSNTIAMKKTFLIIVAFTATFAAGYDFKSMNTP